MMAMLGLATLVFQACAFLARWAAMVRIQKLLRHDQSLNEVILDWEPVVLYKCKTIRGVKMFANRARLLTARHSHGREFPQNERVALVGLAALREIRKITSNETIRNESEFQERLNDWKTHVFDVCLREKPDDGLHKHLNEFFRSVKMEQWELFSSMGDLVEFSERPEDVTLGEPVNT